MATSSLSSSVASAAARGTLLSMFLRLLSFFLTQATVRFVDASSLGKASIQLELLLNTALFLGREGFRLSLAQRGDDCSDKGGQGGQGVPKTEEAMMRLRKVDDARWQRTVNASWLSVPFGALLSLVALTVHLYLCRRIGADDTNYDAASAKEEDIDYRLAGILYCTASLVETLSEPLVIRCFQTMDVSTRAASEGAAVLSRSVVCVLLLGGGFGGVGATRPVSAFGASQLAYASVLSGSLYWFMRGRVPWPRWVGSYGQDGDAMMGAVSNPYQEKAGKSGGAGAAAAIRQNFDMNALRMAVVFSVQGVLKHLLTEGDRIVLTALADAYDQGVYAMASSYGGTAARLLLQPLEENARLLFSRQNASLNAWSEGRDNTTAAAVDGEKMIDGKVNGSSVADESLSSFPPAVGEEMVRDLENSYAVLVKLVLYVGLLFGTVAVNYTGVLLRLLAGSRWSSNLEATAALSAFCAYTALLALNGTTEAFVYGVAGTGSEVGELGAVHAAVGGVFAIVAPILVRASGTVGLVGANALAMALRSAYSLRFAARYFRRRRAGVFLVEKGVDVSGSSARTFARPLLPHPVVMVGFALSFVVTGWSRRRLAADEESPALAARGALSGAWLAAAGRHVSVGILCVVCVGFVAWRFEGEFRLSLKSMVRRKKRD